ncbi:hypothetical protein GCM10022243_10050 [Saccharothrix violaceirubra]|uniref:Tetratricopeptide (TPR) repeat protein n=1 Tax=Saccharothrix violaceirubra TaxID=413306 RepID=A0A7W7T432_9PSEU|nr:hypothetical protein [Saccharothrix violaceirubra]MBB4966156.1 tetratricopeptide (TPR) repeat protein [Saccharothrix violaceirubra]
METFHNGLANARRAVRTGDVDQAVLVAHRLWTGYGPYSVHMVNGLRELHKEITATSPSGEAASTLFEDAATALAGFGLLRQAEEEWKRCVEVWGRREAADPTDHNRFGYVAAIENLAGAFWARERQDRVVDCLDRSIACYDRWGWKGHRATAFRELGAVLLCAGRFEAAEQYAIIAEKQHDEVSAETGRTCLDEVKAHVLHARIAHARGRKFGARQSLNSARALAARLTPDRSAEIDFLIRSTRDGRKMPSVTTTFPIVEYGIVAEDLDDRD